MNFSIVVIALTYLVLGVRAVDGAEWYIIKMKDGIGDEQYQRYFQRTNEMRIRNERERPAPHARGRGLGWSFGSFYGFSGEFYDDEIDEFRRDPLIDLVEKDLQLQAHGSTTAHRLSSRTSLGGAHWNLVRISNRDPPPYPHGSYNFRNGVRGKGMFAYVLDTGLRDHEEFAGMEEFKPRIDRDVIINNVLSPDQTQQQEDTEGHGTALAGVIAGVTYGMLSGATIVPIKINDHNVSEPCPCPP